MIEIQRRGLCEDWIRNITLVQVTDGDTIVVDMDMGKGIWVKGQIIRLLGVNCPEKNKKETREAGLLAMAFTEQWLDEFDGPQPDLIVQTFLEKKKGRDKQDSFGRLLGIVGYRDLKMTLNQALLDNRHAVPFMQDTW